MESRPTASKRKVIFLLVHDSPIIRPSEQRLAKQAARKRIPEA